MGAGGCPILNSETAECKPVCVLVMQDVQLASKTSRLVIDPELGQRHMFGCSAVARTRASICRGWEEAAVHVAGSCAKTGIKWGIPWKPF